VERDFIERQVDHQASRVDHQASRLSDEFRIRDSATPEARRKLADPALAQLFVILAKHRAAPKCQFDGFAEHVAAAEAQGVESYPLYQWTKATILVGRRASNAVSQGRCRVPWILV
jgi:hypothetical protein